VLPLVRAGPLPSFSSAHVLSIRHVSLQTKNDTVHYVVTAVDTAANESNPSGEIEKTPFDDPPSRP
jgi:hypothetical protein